MAPRKPSPDFRLGIFSSGLPSARFRSKPCPQSTDTITDAQRDMLDRVSTNLKKYVLRRIRMTLCSLLGSLRLTADYSDFLVAYRGNEKRAIKALSARDASSFAMQRLFSLNRRPKVRKNSVFRASQVRCKHPKVRYWPCAPVILRQH